MARGHVLRPEGERLLQQAFELHVAIAGDTGIRRPAFCIVSEKIVDDLFLEHLTEIHRIVRNADNLTDAAGIIDGTQAATAAVVVHKIAAIVGEAHGNADDIVPLLHKQCRRQRAIDAA